MASKYLVGAGTKLWNQTSSWALTSGGAPGASVPTENDNVFLDANSPNLQIEYAIIAECNNFNCTGFDGTIILWELNGIINVPSHLIVHGEVNLSSTTTIEGNPDYPSNPTSLEIYGELNIDGSTIGDTRLSQYGALGTIQNVIATNVDSSHGRKIYAPGSTLTTCLNWTTSAYSASTIHITNAGELQDISNDLTADYILDNDIDLTGVDFVPIGAGVGPFVGTFNGQGFKISNLTISLASAQIDDASGLFAFIGLYPGNIRAFISNLYLENVDLTGIYALGAICGFMEVGMILNCHVTNITIHGDPGNLSGGVQSAGGIGGDCFATGGTGLPSIVKDCTVDGFIMPGGLDCYLNYVGGLLGQGADSTDGFIVENCSAINVNIDSINGSELVGGLIGKFYGTMEKCFAVGTIDFVSADAVLRTIGGLVGNHEGDITDCYCRVPITFSTTGEMFIAMIGGFCGSVGNNVGSILNCYSTGDITITTEPTNSQYDGIGGFLGRSIKNIVNTFENCYSVGIVTADAVDLDNDTVGGFIGYKNNCTITNCAWYTSAYDYAIGQPTQEWSNSKSYVVNDIVAVQGVGTEAAYYICTVNNSNKYPPSNLTKWAVTTNPATSRNLDPLGLGTDESNNTTFYTTDHPVYA